MYIAPNSTIKILKNVPLDSSYEHTLYFAKTSMGLSAQQAYFASLAKYTLTGQSYQRIKKGWLRVEIVSDNLYDCNYLMFQNTNFGSKWFYAFIKSVEYINNAVSEIEFEIDVMQTWNSEYTLDQCFVEREHSETDNVGDNIIPENLDIGTEYVSSNMTTVDLSDGGVFLMYYETRSGNNHGNFLLDKVYSQIPCGYLGAATPSNLQHINDVVDALYADEIVALYQFPLSLFTIQNNTITLRDVPVVINTSFNTIQGYSVKNKKLFHQFDDVDNCFDSFFH